MTEFSKRILESYQVRKTKKQKTAFIDFMKTQIPELKVEEEKFPKCRNLVVGDLVGARVVFTAHYDTCAALPVPNLITPKNILFTLLYGILLVIPLLALSVGATFLVGFLTSSFWLSYFTFLIVMLGLASLMIVGKPNKHTVNDNTSGVITLCELMEALSEEQRAKAAFVFFDHEETGLLGSSIFRIHHKEEMQDKLLINFDCVSDGDHLMLVLSKKAEPQYRACVEAAFPPQEGKEILIEKAAKVFYPSDQMGFPQTIAACALKKSKVLGLYMDRIHTRRDTVMDEQNIEIFCSGMKALTEIL